MALVTHQVQGSYTSLSPPSWKREFVSKSFLVQYPTVKRTEIILVKHRSCLCAAALPICGSKWKPIRILSFKGSAQNDNSGGKASGSNSIKNSVKLPRAPQEGEETLPVNDNSGGRASGLKSIKNSVKLPHAPQEGEETLPVKPKVQRIRACSGADADETKARSLARQDQFKNWLTLLRTPAPNQVVGKTLEGPVPSETLEMEHRIVIVESVRSNPLKAAWCYFLALDAKIKIPAMIFIPMYLAVCMKYGAEVAKELTPWWIVGPLIAALYVRTLQWIFSIYVVSYEQSVKLVKELPTYCAMACGYVAQGKLEEVVRARVWQPIVDFRNLDFKEESERKKKELYAWMKVTYEDYMELIWPIHYRTIRFLKMVKIL